MALRVIFSASASAAIRRAAAWWRVHRPAAPDAVGADLAAAVALIADYPAVGSRCNSTRLPGVRRLLLGRIRYHVYYVAEGDTLKVLAFWHANREAEPPILG